MNAADITFRAMGSEIRLIVADPPAGGDAAAAADDARRLIEDFDARLSRFRPDSELCALNADPRPAVPASALLRKAVESGLWAARTSYGLIDPTLVREIEEAGYESSLDGVAPASLREALLLAPARRPARPGLAAHWSEIRVDNAAGLIHRPPGVRFDTGGTGKGLAADLAAEMLRGCERFVVNCGGDLRVGGAAIADDPIEIHVEHPLTHEHRQAISLRGGAVATSGIDTRLWRRANGRYAHHLLDPSTGEPAWTGLISATAAAPTTLEAETLSKRALLSGPAGARALLAEHGGLIVHDDGESETLGPIKARPLVSVTIALGADGRVAA